MVGLPNVLSSYPRINEPVKDLISACAGVMVLRAVGMKVPVGQLPIKTLAFGAGTIVTGAALGREAYIRYKRDDLDFSDRSHRNKMNKDYVSLALLTIFAAGTFTLTQYSKVGAYLPTFTQLSRNQGLALAGSATLALVGLRYFGFAKQPRTVTIPLYNETTHGDISIKSMEQMQELSQNLQAKQVRFASDYQKQVYNKRVDDLVGQAGHDQLRKV